MNRLLGPIPKSINNFSFCSFEIRYKKLKVELRTVVGVHSDRRRFILLFYLLIVNNPQILSGRTYI